MKKLPEALALHKSNIFILWPIFKKKYIITRSVLIFMTNALTQTTPLLKMIHFAKGVRKPRLLHVQVSLGAK